MVSMPVPSPASLRSAPSPARGEGAPAGRSATVTNVDAASDPAVGTPSPLAGEGGAQRRMRGGGPNRGIGSPARLKGVARSLRRRQTDYERILWNLLRNRRFAEFTFRRQVAIGPYVADFFCFEARLVIELDGSQHAESVGDQLRDRWFYEDDFRVLRIWNSDLIRNKAGVLDTIWFALHPSPASLREAPSPAGGEGIPTEAFGPVSANREGDRDG
jgi:very-short-patch-repair endonuclease